MSKWNISRAKSGSGMTDPEIRMSLDEKGRMQAERPYQRLTCLCIPPDPSPHVLRVQTAHFGGRDLGAINQVSVLRMPSLMPIVPGTSVPSRMHKWDLILCLLTGLLFRLSLQSSFVNFSSLLSGFYATWGPIVALYDSYNRHNPLGLECPETADVK